MRKYFFSLLTIIMVAIMSVNFVSCTDDGNNNRLVRGLVTIITMVAHMAE